MSPLYCVRQIVRAMSTVMTKNAYGMLKDKVVSALVLGLLVLGVSAVSWAETKVCGNETLNPYGDLTNNYKTDLKVTGLCDVNGTPDSKNRLLYVFQNVNIVGGGVLKFHDDHDVDFYAESIVIEGTYINTPPTLNSGKLVAVSTQKGFVPEGSLASDVLPFQTRLTFHLWGAPGDAGIECASALGPNGAPCGIPNDPNNDAKKGLWDSNPIMATDMMMDPPPPPPTPKNQGCTSIKGYSAVLPGDDCFYQYEIQDKQDRQQGRKAYFGHKVLAVSFGGTLQLFGSRGVTYLKNGEQCMPGVVNNECNPAFTGTSWVRLNGVTDATHITVDRSVDWKMNDHIVLTPTDYLPSHAEEVILAEDANGGTALTLQSPGLSDKYTHNAITYDLNAHHVPSDVGPSPDPNLACSGKQKRCVDTRAAVGLLTRNIQIVSEGDVPSMPFTEAPGNYYGGHTIVRQGFASYQVQGVEFDQLGQGGAKGRYPVHFHMARSTPQQTDKTMGPLNYLKDSSIHDSMTRWVTLHGTEGMYLARNVGFKSIGHGYYLEDATETNNKLYGNLGVLARAAILDKVHNPRQVPGILADNQANIPPYHDMDYMPYRSDYNHPSIFWITNGSNDFQYNFAAGAATCGACYWWLGTANSGPSQYEYWEGYASQQIDPSGKTNYNRAAITPLNNFVGNSCVAAMNSFQMNRATAECLGVQPPMDGATDGLVAVRSQAPNGPDDTKLDKQPFQLYYPVATDVHDPTICTAKNCSTQPQCDSAADSRGNCTVTHLDRYTTSFNFAQTNFAAVWLRKGWNLVTNSAFTDVQTGGLNFITGGGYTRSDVGLGEWMLGRNSVFIGHSQPQPGQKMNTFAEDVGPFNPDSGLACDNDPLKGGDSNRCEYADGGVSFDLPIFPAQKLINIYDGPSHQANNAYLDINMAKVNCDPTQQVCFGSGVPLTWHQGVLKDKDKTYCYLPNAAIAWKQPNGFYYPPAFHSRELWFDNVDIRHFVVEPLFKTVKYTDYDPFQQDQDLVKPRYCTYTDNMFSASFNNIDRQTVLNDDDGTLTGLVGALGGVARPSISVNEDSFFNAPLTTPECLSDIGVKPPVPEGQPFTARTSPYEWQTTAIIADCAISQKGGQQCLDDTDKRMKWGTDCGNSNCRGVPLYREYLTKTENAAGTRPAIRMMGLATGQRSTLALNYGSYYIDTTQNCTSQAGAMGCPLCTKFNENNAKQCVMFDPTNPYRPSIFLGGETYYVYFVYATERMKQKYDIYVGPNFKLDEVNVRSIQVNPNNYKINYPSSSFVDAQINENNSSILSVSVDLSKQSMAFTDSKPLFCKPKSYCTPQSDGSCGCMDGNRECAEHKDCTWASNDIDCPVDPKDPDKDNMQCFGFSVTMPKAFKAPDLPMKPPDELFGVFQGSYFQNGYVTFLQGEGSSKNGECVYNPPPVQE